VSHDDEVLRLSGEKRESLLGEFWKFPKQSNQWWLPPIPAATLPLDLMEFHGGSGAALFINLF
jgi:hypothetical protein